MKKILMSVVLLALVFAMAGYSAPKFKSGQWKIVSKTEITGIQYKVPPVEFTQCLDEKNFLPRKKEDKSNCKILNQKVEGNKIFWEMSCPGKEGTTTGKGSVEYTDQTMQGEMTFGMAAKGKTMSGVTHLNGSYVGACQ